MTEDLVTRHDCLLEHYCGAVGSRFFEKKVLQTLTIILFHGVLQDGSVECFSIGMSDVVQPRNPSLDRDVRTEIYCSADERYLAQALELMESLARYPHAMRTHLHWGHSLQLGNTISGCFVSGALMTMPPFRAEMMSANCARIRIDLLRLIPLVDKEFQLVKDIGPDKFEELLENSKTDVTDFSRAPVPAEQEGP